MKKYFNEAVKKLNEDADIFINYFEMTYIGALRGERLTKPVFAIEDWNCHKAVMESFAKTNNALEGINRRLSSMFVGTSDNLWRFLEVRATFSS